MLQAGWLIKKYKFGTAKKTQRVKILAAKLDSQSLIPRTHVVGGGNQCMNTYKHDLKRYKFAPGAGGVCL